MRIRGSIVRGVFWIAAIAFLVSFAPNTFSQGVVVDHRCTDLARIPDSWLEQVKARIKLQFCHTSHGLQLKAGMERLADGSLPVYDARLVYAHAWKKLPDGPGLSIMGGQTTEFYTTPEQYWRSGGDSLTRATLDSLNSINVSMFCWCREMDKYTESDVNAYLAAISNLEQAYPGVKFVYMTGNAQATGPGSRNSELRNRQIREFCLKNGKILYDFADLDIWHDGEPGSYDYQGREIPREHPSFRGDDAGHASFLSCETKAKALWWLLAVLAGWDTPQDLSPGRVPAGSGRR